MLLLSLNLQGSVAGAGTANIVLDAVLIASAGVALAAGGESSSLASASSTSQGSAPAGGAETTTLGSASVAGQGASAVAGSASVALGGAAVVGSGSAPSVGAAAKTLGSAVSVSQGAAPTAGATAKTLSSATGVSAGIASATGAETTSLAAATGAGQGSAQASGTATPSLGGTSLSSSSSASSAGSSSLAAGGAAVSGSGAVQATGIVAANLGNISCSGQAPTPSPVLAIESMTVNTHTFVITGTSPAAAGQAAVGNAVAGLDLYESFFVTASLIGATGGTLDVYLQRRVTDDGTVWADFAHFPQLAAGAAAVKYNVATMPPAAATATAVGITANDGTTGAPALAANTVVAGHPGDQVRVVAVAGASTTVGAAITIYIKGRRSPR